MAKSIKIKVADLIGGQICLSHEDGQRVFDKVKALLRDNRKVIISFDQVKVLIPSFLNVAIGQLYGSFGAEEIRTKLKVEKMDPDDMGILKEVVDNAKKYYGEL